MLNVDRLPRSIRLSLGIFAVLLLLLAYLSFGAIQLPVAEILQVLKLTLSGSFEQAQQAYPKTAAILVHIRLPRAIAAMLTGAALALAGACMQGLFRNPLASPDILGVSAGSSLGAVIAITTGMSLIHPLMIPLFSITGALLTAGLVYLIALRTASQRQLLFLILTGLALSSLLNGAVSATLLMARQYEISQFIFWTMGGLEGRLWPHVLWPAPFLLVIGLISLRQSTALNLITLGEENAHGMGLNVKQHRQKTLLLSASLTALAISIGGPIGFIGLMVPHLVRLIIGPDHRKLLPIAAITGSCFVLLADLLGRCLLAPHEIKVGIITSVIGGSYFIYLIARIQKQGATL
ncbi:FecCD family ABC transporter permease [Reinekea marinisedimentorum]|uniref:Iron complex transport system permease protein n=1 Tax=Reinekea marinisedimentorum TaxID=230495 RepID=A0A4R3ICA5_9GAMM|nr:iron ABC transporter permease [Reinekea marinisedimentorum]TCS43255.1 iron complex transport system permease protein [Reinekea marinisedimentorum]